MLLADVLQQKPRLIERLALCLDRERRLIPNWKHLSCQLNVDPKVVARLQQYTDFSPTIRLFEYLEVWQPDLSIFELKTALLGIERNDLFTLLTTKGDYPNYSITRFRCQFISQFHSAHPRAGPQTLALPGKCPTSRSNAPRCMQ